MDAGRNGMGWVGEKERGRGGEEERRRGGEEERRRGGEEERRRNTYLTVGLGRLVGVGSHLGVFYRLSDPSSPLQSGDHSLL